MVVITTWELMYSSKQWESRMYNVPVICLEYPEARHSLKFAKAYSLFTRRHSRWSRHAGTIKLNWKSQPLRNLSVQLVGRDTVLVTPRNLSRNSTRMLQIGRA